MLLMAALLTDPSRLEPGAAPSECLPAALDLLLNTWQPEFHWGSSVLAQLPLELFPVLHPDAGTGGAS